MLQRPLRFVHASDFHLERPLAGFCEVPEHLRDLFIDAPYRAAQKVFDIALAEHVDFVILSGDLLDPEGTGPRGPLFLLEQFNRLAERHVPVYWATGETDRVENWPAAVRLGEGVRVFGRTRPEEFVVTRDGHALAHLTGAGNPRRQQIRAADFWPDKTGLLSIAVVHGDAVTEQLSDRAIDYWALGGSIERATLFSTPHVAHYPGTPQARRPGESGPHGCTLVTVGADRQITLTPVTTEVMRYSQQRITIDATWARQKFEQALDARLEELLATSGGVDLLVSWSVSGAGALASVLRQGRGASDILARANHQFGHRSPAAWSMGLAWEAETSLAESWFEQDSMRGEFLRAVRDLETAGESTATTALNLKGYLGENQRAGPLAALIELEGADQRLRVLRHAALLGADLLSGEEAQS